MTAEQIWNEFIVKNNIQNNEYEAWAFGENPNQLAQLVISGDKTATSSAYVLYEMEKEPLPKAGSYSVILNEADEAQCIIQTTRVYVQNFLNVSPLHAYKEGEGDKSLDYWREVHKEFFSKCFHEMNLEFDENMKVVCEEFELVYTKGE